MFFNVKAMLKVMIISKGFKVGLMISLSQVWYTWGFVDLWICGFMFQKFNGWDMGSVICISKS
jgi:hypothetical protein